MVKLTRICCFFCNYEIRSKKYRTVNYKNSKKIVCYKCTPLQHKALKQIYKNYTVDRSVCFKVVKNNNCLACSECDHFVHSSCNELSQKDITKLEKSPHFTCKTCVNNIFPFSKENFLISKKEKCAKNTKQRTQCFMCTNIIESKRYNQT